MGGADADGNIDDVHQVAGNTGDSDTISRGAIVGLFLTLSLLLLSQPYGSVIYRRNCGRFWRLNPLACGLEALVIFFTLTTTVVDTLKRRPRRPVLMLVQALLEEVHTTSAALLLARAEVDRHPDEVLLLEADPNEGATEQLLSKSPDSVANNGEPSSATQTPAQQAPATDGSTATLDEEPVFNRRATIRLEEGTIGLPDSESTQPLKRLRPALLYNAIGSNGPRKYEFQFQIIVFLAGVGGIVKVCSMAAIPLTFRLAGGFMLAGWLALQALLLIFHAGNVDNRRMRNIASRSSLFQADSSNCRSALQISAVPISLFLFYLCVRYGLVKPNMEYNTLQSILHLPFDTAFHILVFEEIYVLFSLTLKRAGDFLNWVRGKRGHIGLWSIPDFLARLTASIGATFTCLFSIDIYLLGGDFLPVISSPMLQFLVKFHYYCLFALCVLFFFKLSLVMLLERSLIDPEPVQGLYGRMIGFWNLTITALVFAVFLQEYDLAGTHQPGWISWFG